MKTRPKIRITKRVLRSEHCFNDKPRLRWVVYRRAGGVTRKTSVRYGQTVSHWEATARAKAIAARLHAWPADKLAQFKFNQ